MAVHVEGEGADGEVSARLRGRDAVELAQDLRRGRAGAAHVRHRKHRRQGLEGPHRVQGYCFTLNLKSATLVVTMLV